MSRGWKLFLLASLILGSLLRFCWVNDMEYKEDEEYNYTQSQKVGTTIGWPLIGMPSGVYIPNPGMSVWIFAVLAKLTGAKTPTELDHAVEGFALLGILMILPFAEWFVRRPERPIWFWAFALAMVNPFQVFYQRKLWPEPFLPFFTILMLMGWWRREKKGGAFVWGLIGAVLGQIHMSGFFFSAGFWLWTLAFGKKVHWRAWMLGTLLSLIPLLPWLKWVLTHPAGGTVASGIEEAMQLKFWVFWITDPLGLHLGNPLGLLRSQNTLERISEFARYPLVGRAPTYIVGAAHALVLGVGLVIYIPGIYRAFRKRKRLSRLVIGRGSDSAFAQNAGFWGFGILMTATTVVIRRYYMMVSFPLEFIFLIQMAYLFPDRAKKLLSVLWIAELVISLGFVWFIHVNQGSLEGDYGKAYHLIQPVIKPILH